MRTIRRGLGSERGSVVVMVAVSLFMMMALAAFAVDLAFLRDSKAEAQRAADAIALAGASAFRDLPWNDATTSAIARDRAYEIARKNEVRRNLLDTRDSTWVLNSYAWGKVYVSKSLEVTLNVIPDSQKVRVWVRRQGIRTFFAKLLARPFGHVQAMATAWATNSGVTVNCLKPFVLPDRWYESDKVTQDVNGNNYMEPQVTSPGKTVTGESWKYQPAAIGGQDYYVPFDPTVSPPPGQMQTGYGSGIYSTVLGGDIGMPMFLKPQTGGGNDPSGGERMGNAFWLLDGNPDLNTRDEIKSECMNASIGDTPKFATGSQTGQVGGPSGGVTYLVNQDPGAKFNPATGQIDGSNYQDWTKSPRVILIGLVDPKYWMANSRNDKPDPGATFTNFARMFLVGSDKKGPPDNVQAIFLGMAPGGDPGPTAHTLVKVLQLIQ
jgi:putative Flp pilus-assembly TadE/G-like protein